MLIKDIPNNERPRERLLKYGIESLSNEELLSIVISSGTKDKSCKEISLEILKYFDNINNLKNANVKQLSDIYGIGLSKACNIMASIELGKRVYSNIKNTNTKIVNSNDIYEYMKNDFIGKKQEYFYALYFDNKQRIIDKKLLFIGTINRSLVHPREVFKYAYLFSAYSIAIVHNHPSGDVNPSKEDISITDTIVSLGKINKIPLIDHIIVGIDTYFSFCDNMMI
jgi:DNA repair protein RadC